MIALLAEGKVRAFKGSGSAGKSEKAKLVRRSKSNIAFKKVEGRISSSDINM
jgi:hypothetical protein